jgi:hypothetical protein
MQDRNQPEQSVQLQLLPMMQQTGLCPRQTTKQARTPTNTRIGARHAKDIVQTEAWVVAHTLQSVRDNTP